MNKEKIIREYMSMLAKKSVEARIKKMGAEGLHEHMIKMARKSVKLRKKSVEKIKKYEQKNNL